MLLTKAAFLRAMRIISYIAALVGTFVRHRLFYPIYGCAAVLALAGLGLHWIQPTTLAGNDHWSPAEVAAPSQEGPVEAASRQDASLPAPVTGPDFQGETGQSMNANGYIVIGAFKQVRRAKALAKDFSAWHPRILAAKPDGQPTNLVVVGPFQRAELGNALNLLRWDGVQKPWIYTIAGGLGDAGEGRG